MWKRVNLYSPCLNLINYSVLLAYLKIYVNMNKRPDYIVCETRLTLLQQMHFEKQFLLWSQCIQLFLRIIIYRDLSYSCLDRFNVVCCRFLVCEKGLNLCANTHLYQNGLIDWLGFNAVFNNFSVISRRPVHLLICFLVFANQYSTQQSSQATGCFFT